MAELVSSVGVNRNAIRRILMVGLFFSAVFAGWVWFRPYQWAAPEGARCHVVGCQVKQDRTNYWVDVHLRMNAGEVNDLMMPVRLVTAADRKIEPADTTIGSDESGGTSDLWYKFWLEEEDLKGLLNLAIHEGQLEIRTQAGLPKLGASGIRYYTTKNW